MTDQSLVLVWEENPDAVRLYQVPSHKKICAIMRAAHGQMINREDLPEDAPVFAVNEWVEQHGKKYLVEGVVAGNILAVTHCGFFL